jgi:hypothetical protein
LFVRGDKTGRNPYAELNSHDHDQNPMSSSKAKATNPPLSLEDILHDLAVIRTSDVDLAAILASMVTQGPSDDTAPTSTDASVARSHEFTQAARAAIKLKNRGDVEAQGERVNDVRGQLEEVAEGLSEGSIRERMV